MKRFNEILADVRDEYPEDEFFSDLEESCRAEPWKKRPYRAYERALRFLDEDSWKILKRKALEHYLDHREGQRKQGFFNQLNEAFAYRHLVRSGFESVRFVEEGRRRTPDIRFGDPKAPSYCEVKTVGISDNEIRKRKACSVYSGSVYSRLSDGFLNKLKDCVSQALEQIQSVGKDGLVFIVILFDDFTLDYYDRYRKQLIEFADIHEFHNLLMKMGTIGNRRVYKK